MRATSSWVAVVSVRREGTGMGGSSWLEGAGSSTVREKEEEGEEQHLPDGGLAGDIGAKQMSWEEKALETDTFSVPIDQSLEAYLEIDSPELPIKQAPELTCTWVNSKFKEIAK